MSLSRLMICGSAVALAAFWLMPETWGQQPNPNPNPQPIPQPQPNPLGNLGGIGGIGQQKQLNVPLLRTNWYMYNSVGGMGTTGGTDRKSVV